uniref:RNA binding protein, putative n=1 Tax=Theileria annulata TaxID=5874 RepID=A0A3B0N3P7_THEAN
MSHYRRSYSRDRSYDDYSSRRHHKRDLDRYEHKYRKRSRSRSHYRKRYRSRSRSRSRGRDYYRDYDRDRDKRSFSIDKNSYSRDKRHQSEASDSEKKTASSSLTNEFTLKKKQSSWDSLTPVSSISPELCDTKSLTNNKKTEQSKAQEESQKSAKIYIGALDPSCTIEDIRVIFSSFGDILNIDLPTDPETNKVKGFCFVEYRKKESADLALVSMQGFHIKGKPIKLGRPNVSSSGSSSGICPIGYNNPLSNPLAAGAVAAATLLQNRSGVRVDTSNVLTKISASTPTFTIGATPPELNGKRVVLENIPFDLAASDIRRIFEPFGAITECVLYSREMLPGAFYALGYIDFVNANVAQTVCSTMNGFEIAGSKIQVTMAPESSVAGTSNVIVIYNMVDPKLVDENLQNEVKDECNKYGTVTSVYLHFSPNNDSLSVFVVFNTPQDADSAVRALNTRWFNGRQIMCKTYDASAYFSGNYDL